MSERKEGWKKVGLEDEWLREYIYIYSALAQCLVVMKGEFRGSGLGVTKFQLVVHLKHESGHWYCKLGRDGRHLLTTSSTHFLSLSLLPMSQL